MSRTTKPCPACGKVDSDRPADQICVNCQRKLERLEFLERQLQQQAAESDLVIYHPRYYWNAHFIAESRDFREHLEKAFFALAQALSSPAPQMDFRKRNEAVYILGQPSGRVDYFLDIQDYHLLPAGSAQKFDDLRKLVQEALRAEYKQGVLAGRNLLRQLAAGEMKIDEFNRISAKLEEKK